MAQKVDIGFFGGRGGADRTSPEARRRDAMAEMIARSSQQPEGTEIVSGVAVQQSPIAGLAKALGMGVSGYQSAKAEQAEQSRKDAARQTMAQAMEAYNRSQSGGQTQLANGDAINWNVTDPNRAGSMYADLLMQNEDTAPIGMQTQMGQMQTKMNNANELDMYKQKFPMELDLARAKAQIEAQYRAPPAAPASYQEFMLAQQNPDFAAWKNKQSVDPVTGEPIRKLSAAEQKEVFDIQEKTDATGGAISALQRAKEILGRTGTVKDPVTGKVVEDINPAPYTGMGADARTAAARIPLIGGLVADKERAAATTEAKNLVTEQALGSMKAIFGGNPTEGERNILLQLQALPTYTPGEQAVIIDNAIKAAERRQQNFGTRLQQIGTGQYFTQPAPVQPNMGNPNATVNPAIATPVDQIQPLLNADFGNVPKIATDADWDALPPGAEFIGPDGQKRRK